MIQEYLPFFPLRPLFLCGLLKQSNLLIGFRIPIVTVVITTAVTVTIQIVKIAQKKRLIIQ